MGAGRRPCAGPTRVRWASQETTKMASRATHTAPPLNVVAMIFQRNPIQFPGASPVHSTFVCSLLSLARERARERVFREPPAVLWLSTLTNTLFCVVGVGGRMQSAMIRGFLFLLVSERALHVRVHDRNVGPLGWCGCCTAKTHPHP